jgi:RHS repeat-associated protein
MSACQRQHDAYAPLQPFYGYTDSTNWYTKTCNWHTGIGIVSPTIVQFNCATGYNRMPSEVCFKSTENFQQREATSDNSCGGSMNNGGDGVKRTSGPIDILTGAKIFKVTDFETADGALKLQRTYNSLPYGGGGPYMWREPIGLGRLWRFQFEHELHIHPSFSSGAPYVELETAYGASLLFKENAPSTTLLVYYYNNTPQTDYTLEFVGSWPANLPDVLTMSTQWRLHDADDTVWILQTFLDPGSGKYIVARPVSATFRGGLTWTIQYGTYNQPISITDSYGKVISLTWSIEDPSTLGSTAPKRALAITSAGLPDGTSLNYVYDSANSVTIGLPQPNRLIEVDRLDAASTVVDSTSYAHENTDLPFNVTGITDFGSTRRWNVTYDLTGRATLSSGPSGADQYTVSYTSSYPNYTRTVTNALGKSATYNYKIVTLPFEARLLSVTGVASTHCPASTGSYSYDSNRFVSQYTDEEGRVTNFVREARGMATSITRGYGTPQAVTTTYTWHSTFHEPTEIVQPGLTTDFTWNSSEQLTQVTQTDTTTTGTPYSTNGQTRTWAYTYDTFGHLLTVDGPLSGTGDTVTYTYDASGYLASITNELGQVTTVTAVNGRGQPTSITDPNGVVSSLTYDSLNRLSSVTVDPSGLAATTQFDYNVVGDITKITRPNGAYLQYTYDDARRITKIEDNTGSSIELDRDLMDNVTARRIKDPSSTLQLSQTATFDELGRLLTFVGNASQTWTHAYDKTDNRVSVTDPRSHVFHWAFDSLSRLISTTDEDSGAVTLTRNGQDKVTNYSDPRSLSTSYVRDGFGDIIQRASPDSGTTVYYYNALAKPTQITDGRSIVTNLAYDNAGRLLTKQYPAATAENITYTWDATTSGNKGVGRITRVDDASGSVEWFYNVLGQITQETKTTASVVYPIAYTYDLDGNVTQITYPSGRIVNFARDSVGRITGVTTKKDSGSPLVTLASGITYLPFGPLNALTYGNGLTLSKSYTEDYLISGLQVQDTSTSTVVLNRSYAFGDGINLTGITDSLTSGRSETYTYTNANRLEEGDGIWGTLTWAYDATGNRTSEVLTSGGTTTNTYNYPGGNNKLSSITQGATTVRSFSYDGAGNISADTRGSTAYNYHYNNRNRLDELTIGATVTADYTYDGLERLSIRTTQNMTPAGTTHYVYDFAGHLIAESTDTGTTTREYIWLDDMPLAVVADVDTPSPNLYYVHADHLDRPLKMTDGTEAVVWDAVYNPFGDVNAITGSASNNLRFPGQYFLIEAGLHYNWHRHYDPTIGRYTQTDPIGQALATTPLGLSAPIKPKNITNSDLTDQPPVNINATRASNSDLSVPSEFEDGPSTYAYARSAPLTLTDRKGLFTGSYSRIPKQQCESNSVVQSGWIAPNCEAAWQRCILNFSAGVQCYKSYLTCHSTGLPTIFPGGIISRGR